MGILATTKKIPENTLLRVYKKGYGYAKLTVIVNADMFFACAANAAFLKQVKDGGKIDAYLWVENEAAYEFKLTVAGRITVGEPVLFFNHTDIISRSEERKCLRAKVKIKSNFFVFEPKDLPKAVNINSQDIKRQTGTITELTDREFLFTTQTSLPEGKFLFTSLNIGQNGESEELQLIGKYSPKGKDGYLVDINSLSKTDRAKLLDYIIGVYRE